MRFQSLLKRDPHTVVTFGAVRYEFLPDEHGRHVCDIQEAAHIERLLQIPEGYRALDEQAPAPVVPGITLADPVTPIVTTGAPMTYTEARPVSVAPAAPVDLMSLERTELAALYVAKLGKEPAARWTKANIIEALSIEVDA